MRREAEPDEDGYIQCALATCGRLFELRHPGQRYHSARCFHHAKYERQRARRRLSRRAKAKAKNLSGMLPAR